MAKLNLISQALAYDDGDTDTGRKPFWWDRSLRSITVDLPSAPEYRLAAGETQTIFSGTRTTTFAGDTQLTLALSVLAATRYRLTWTAGTNPTFRTNRNLTLATHQITVAGNANATATWTSNTAGDFTAVQVGDFLHVPGVKTGDDAGPFSDINCGHWEVLGKTGSTILQLRRPVPDAYEATGETVTIAANGNVVAYSAAGVQAGDDFDLSAGFSATVLGTYEVAQVTPGWVEFLSTAALPVSEAATPGAAGIVFYSAAKRFVRVEADQEVVARFNGDSGNTCRVSPWTAGSKETVGWVEKVGPTWSLVVHNRSASVARVRVFSAE